MYCGKTWETLIRHRRLETLTSCASRMRSFTELSNSRMYFADIEVDSCRVGHSMQWGPTPVDFNFSVAFTDNATNISWP
jgi:hypothetical protein